MSFLQKQEINRKIYFRHSQNWLTQLWTFSSTLHASTVFLGSFAYLLIKLRAWIQIRASIQTDWIKLVSRRAKTDSRHHLRDTIWVRCELNVMESIYHGSRMLPIFLVSKLLSRGHLSMSAWIHRALYLFSGKRFACTLRDVPEISLRQGQILKAKIFSEKNFVAFVKFCETSSALGWHVFLWHESFRQGRF